MEENKGEKQEFTTKTDEWSSSIEKVVKNIGENCRGYKWMHIRIAKHTKLKYNILMYILMTIGPISGLISTISIVYERRGEGVDTLEIISIVFGVASGILGAWVKFSKLEEKSSSHKGVAAKYSSLESNIRRQLTLQRKERVNAGKYLEWVSRSYEDLFASSPLISDSVMEKWIQFAKERKLSLPQEYTDDVDGNNEEDIGQLCNMESFHVADGNVETIDNIEKASKMEAVNTGGIDLIVEGTGTIRRNQKKLTEKPEVYTQKPELHRYSDGKMQYEMSRLYGL